MATNGQGLTDFGGLSPAELSPGGHSEAPAHDDYQEAPPERSSRRKKRSKETVWSRLHAQLVECGQVLQPLLKPPRVWWTASAATVIVSVGAWYCLTSHGGSADELTSDDETAFDAGEFANPDDWPALKKDAQPEAPTEGPVFGSLPTSGESAFPTGDGEPADSGLEIGDGTRQAIHYAPAAAAPGDAHVQPAGYQRGGMPSPAWLSGTIEDDSDPNAPPRAYDNFRSGPR